MPAARPASLADATGFDRRRAPGRAEAQAVAQALANAQHRRAGRPEDRRTGATSSPPSRCSGVQRLQLSLIALVALAAAPASAPAAATTIAPVLGQNPVRAFAGVQAWTTYSKADHRWHVVVRRSGQISAPAIAPGGSQLKVDVGPGPDGKPMLAYIGCAGGCRVVLSDVDGANARALPRSTGATSVSVYGSRVAWVKGRDTVLVRDLRTGATTRVPGAPRRKCWTPFAQGGVKPPPLCEATSSGSVDDIDLDGSRLGLIVSYSLEHASGSGTTEVRIESVRGGSQRLLALMNVGEGQQTWIGPSWAQHELFFYRTCPFACGRAEGAFRYDPDRRAFAHAPVSLSVSGFAMDDDAAHAFEVLGLFGGRDDTPEEFDTTLELSDRLHFARARPPIAPLG
jgi:hypothetical protein